MSRDQALQLVEEMLKNPNLIKHCLAVEAIMRALARELRLRHPDPDFKSGEGSLSLSENTAADIKSEIPRSARNDNIGDEFDEGEWGIVGLLHDADYEITGKDLSRHTIVMEEKLREIGAPERIINGVKAHSDTIKPERENWMEKSIWAADELSGLITAVALVRPDKKLSSVEVRSVLKRFPEKSFAAGANREQIINGANELGIPLEEFVTIALKAMQSISERLGL